ncbi:cytochrome o ubiquinol oxidase subunit III, partial [Salmonella enterica subsp. enterica serovar Typhi]|nr:cytochrome o ubiquinol oxidase subunit III [Salmonella enterica subsp. enterica serovar Typhi]
IFEITPVVIETILLLGSSFTIGLAINAMRLKKQKAMLAFFAATLVLGLAFLGVEIYDFVVYIHEGATLQTSGFTAILFTLLGTHGAHVAFGILWGTLIILQIKRDGINERTANKAFIFS